MDGRPTMYLLGVDCWLVYILYNAMFCVAVELFSHSHTPPCWLRSKVTNSILVFVYDSARVSQEKSPLLAAELPYVQTEQHSSQTKEGGEQNRCPRAE